MSSNDLVTLKPCPFCKSPDVEVRESVTDALVACNNCGCRTGFVYLGASEASNAAKIKECAGIWNTRDGTLEAEIEVLREALTFYRDQWEQDVDAERTVNGWEGTIGKIEPTEALQIDAGRRAWAALKGHTG